MSINNTIFYFHKIAADKICLRKRALIETVNDKHKNIAQIGHSRHRSFNNFISKALVVPLLHIASLKINPPLMWNLSMTGNFFVIKLYQTHVIYIKPSYCSFATQTIDFIIGIKIGYID